eukprot:scaffold1411_cov396-Prasinococcus_capsulatus_cf.AAC.28
MQSDSAASFQNPRCSFHLRMKSSTLIHSSTCPTCDRQRITAVHIELKQPALVGCQRDTCSIRYRRYDARLSSGLRTLREEH